MMYSQKPGYVRALFKLSVLLLTIYNIKGQHKSLSVGKPSYSSSMYGNSYLAKYGNDGKVVNNNIVATKLENQAWWCVDLGRSTVMGSFIVYNRIDHEESNSRIVGFDIRVRSAGGCNSADYGTARVVYKDNGKVHQGVYNLHIPAQGQYVYLGLNKTTILNFREFTIMPGGASYKNLALNKPVAQSSVLYGHSASRGNDGSTTTSIHTNNNSPVWWCVNLKGVYILGLIRILNQAASLVEKERIRGFEVRASSHGACNYATYGTAPVLHKDKDKTSQDVYSISLASGDLGQFVFIGLPGSGYLHFLEFMVYPEAHGNLALSKSSAQIPVSRSTSDGNDGDINTAAEITNGWWCVDLGKIYPVGLIIVYSHRLGVRTYTSFDIRLSATGECGTTTYNAASVANTGPTAYTEAHMASIYISARFVFIGVKNAFFAFGEIGVYPDKYYGNVAAGRSATYMDDSGDAGFMKIPDGKMDTDVNFFNWFCVDLGRIYQLAMVSFNSKTFQNVRPKFEMKLSATGKCNDATHTSAKSILVDNIGTTFFNVALHTKAKFIFFNSNYGSIRQVEIYPELDECAISVHICQTHCLNTIGSFRCSCDPGKALADAVRQCYFLNLNVALNKTTSMSSAVPGFGSKKGNDNTANTAAITGYNNDYTPSWWCIDLEVIMTMSSIVVQYVRAGFDVLLGLTGGCTAAGLKSSKMCDRQYNNGPFTMNVTSCMDSRVATTGRYVFLRNKRREIRIYEVSIFKEQS